MIQGVHHICLKAKGEAALEQAVDFYTRVLGFGTIRAWGEGTARGCMLDLGNCILEITANGCPDETKGIYSHVAFRVTDVDAAVGLVRAAGYPVTIEPVDKRLGEDYPIRIAFCIGPVGEQIEFFQEYEVLNSAFQNLS